MVAYIQPHIELRLVHGTRTLLTPTLATMVVTVHGGGTVVWYRHHSPHHLITVRLHYQDTAT